MLELSPKILATKEMYALLKTIIKKEYMPKSFEAFKEAFLPAEDDRVEEPYKITKVPFSYVIDKQNYNVKALSLLFFPYGIGWFDGASKE